MDVGMIIFKIALVFMVGFVGSFVARKLKLPNVSGYLVFGLLIGASFSLFIDGYKGIITKEDNEALSFISEIALGFIAFSIGSEFSIKALKKGGKNIAILTTMEVVGAVVIVFAALFFIPKPDVITNGYNPFSNSNVAFGLILASMSAATAPAATLMVIRQYRAYGPVTKTILPITALDDIFGIVVFGFFISFAQLLVPSGIEQPLWLMILKPFIEVFGSIIIGGIIGFVLSKIAKKIDSNRDNIQIMALFAIFLTIGGMSVLNGLLSDYGISFSQLLANIMIGSMVTNMVKKPEKTFNAINDLSTPFYIIFFTLAGASLDLSILKSDSLILLISLVYIIARGAGKVIGIVVGAIMTKSPKVIKKYLGIALLPQGGVSIGLLVIVAAQMQSFHPVISTIIMLSILVYETTGPIFAKLALSKSGELYGLDRIEQLSSIEGITSNVDTKIQSVENINNGE